ncbi:MAG: TetR/AcrR family transcriptional regulator [Haliangiales bacterium]
MGREIVDYITFPFYCDGMTRKYRRLTASERRAQLIEVGREVFAKHGFEGTSVEQIAKRAKVSKPIVYEHFGGKEGLYAVIVDREMGHVVPLIVEAMSTGTPRERVEQASLAFLNYVKDRPDGFAVLSQDSPLTSSRGTMSSLLNDMAERASEVFISNLKEAGYDTDAAPIYAHALVGMVTFVGKWWTDTRKPPVREVAKHMSALAWMGLRHLPEHPVLNSTLE